MADREGLSADSANHSGSQAPDSSGPGQAPQDGAAAGPAISVSSKPRRQRGRQSGGKDRSTSRRTKSTKSSSRRESKQGRLMLVNVAEGDECRIAILQGGILEELYIERAASISHVGNIYKGVVTNVEPGIQAAFIDFGHSKNGFLHISDLHPQYFPGYDGHVEDVGRKTPRRERPPIQRCLRKGQEIIVQVTKEGVGTKGPTLTTYIALPGRYFVMMPGMGRLGISRKIEDEADRRRMREVLESLNLPKNMGFILRTAALDRPKRELQKDLNYLQRLWNQIQRRMKTAKAPAELYRESDLVTRTLRDVLTTDVKKIVIDDAATADRAKQFLRAFSPRMADRVELYDELEPLFYRYGIEDEIAKIHSKYVPLPCGGYLVIEQTEALVAIDVNSGKFRDEADPEEAALKINLEAAQEIARQLRLRDLGGLIVCDFIDMQSDRRRRQVERALREALKKHKERAEILRMSRFGIIEMTRQRQRPSISKSVFTECAACGGTGLVKSAESMMLDTLRAIRAALTRREVTKVELRVNPEVAGLLLNHKRQVLADLETRTGKVITIHADQSLGVDKLEITCLDNRGWPIQVPLPRSLLGLEPD